MVPKKVILIKLIKRNETFYQNASFFAININYNSFVLQNKYTKCH